MADSMTEIRKDAGGPAFAPVPPTTSENDGNGMHSLPPPPMIARPAVQPTTEVRAPPPLKRMSTNNSNDDISPSASESEGEADDELPDSSSLFAQSSKKSNLDSLLGKIIATKQTEDKPDVSMAESLSPPAPPTPSVSDTSVSTADNSAMVTPPPLRRCAPSPDGSKSRRKQAVPQASNHKVAESPTQETPSAIAMPDIDEMLKDCAMVTPVEAPNLEIDIPSDDDEIFQPMRVSSKGRVVKKPSWADAYTDHTATETEEEGGDWTPERNRRSNADSFKPRAPPKPALNSSATNKNSITHDDLHPSMIMTDPSPALLKPFKLGWLRELVIRNPQNENIADMDRKHTTADAYYYSPPCYGSVKLRSVVKIQEFLHEKDERELTSENFSFAKRAFYKPPEEFVRLAGKTGGRMSGSLAGVLKDAKSKNKYPKAATKSPKVNISPKVEKTVVGGGNDKILIHPNLVTLASGGDRSKQWVDVRQQVGIIKPKRPSAGPPSGHSSPMKKIKADKGAVERAKKFLIAASTASVSRGAPVMIASKPPLRIIGPAGKPPSLKQPEPCTSLCRGVANSVPSVQCGVCLLLYHPECINWATSGKDALFVCSICIMKSRLKDHTTSRVNGNADSSSLQSGKISSPLLNQALSQKNAVIASPREATANKSGRLITIPLHVLDKIDTTSPFALKLNNETFKIDPSRLVKTSTGVKIFIKNDQVMKPAEMVSMPSPPVPAVPQMKYRTIFDCYNRVSKKDPGVANPTKPLESTDSASLPSGRSVSLAIGNVMSLASPGASASLKTEPAVKDSNSGASNNDTASASDSQSTNVGIDSIKTEPRDGVESSSTSLASRSLTSAENESATDIAEKSAASSEESNSADVEKKSSGVEEKSSPGIGEKSSPGVEEKSSPGIGEKSSPGVEGESSTNLEDKSQTDNDKHSEDSQGKIGDEITTGAEPMEAKTEDGNEAEPMDTSEVEGSSSEVKDSAGDGKEKTEEETGLSSKKDESQLSKNAQAQQEPSSSLPVTEHNSADSAELLIQTMLTHMVNSVVMFQEENKRYDSQVRQRKKLLARRAASARAPPTDKDQMTSKLNSMNRPTDARPRPFTAANSSVESMSEVLYDAKNTSVNAGVKTYGKQVDSMPAASMLRSLVPKSAPSSNVPGIIKVSDSFVSIRNSQQFIPVSSNISGVPLRQSGAPPIRIALSRSSNQIRAPNVVVVGNNAQRTIPSLVSTAGLPIVFNANPSNKPFVSNQTVISGTAVNTRSLRPQISVASPQALPKVIMVARPGFKGETLVSTAQPPPPPPPPAAPAKVAIIRTSNQLTQTDPEPTPETTPPPPVTAVRPSPRTLSFSFAGDIYSCFVRIFSHLSVNDRLRAGMTCKLWRAVSQDPALTKWLHFDSCVPPASMLTSRVERLSLPRTSSAPSEEFLERLFELENLTSLSLDCTSRPSEGHSAEGGSSKGSASAGEGSWLKGEHMVKLLTMPALAELSIVGGLTERAQLATLSTLPTRAPIRCLSLTGFSSSEVTQIFGALARVSPTLLRTLSLTISSSQTSPFTEDKDEEAELLSIMKKCTNINSLALAYPRMDIDSCEAEYLSDTYSALLPDAKVSVKLYD